MQIAYAKTVNKELADILVLGLFQDEKFSQVAPRFVPQLDAAALADLDKLLAQNGFSGKKKESADLLCRIPGLPPRIMLLGLGEENDYAADQTRKLGAKISRKLKSLKTPMTVSIVTRAQQNAATVAAICEGLILGSFSFNRYKTKNEEQNTNVNHQIYIVMPDLEQTKFEQGLHFGSTVGTSTNFARNLANEPACNMTPAHLAEIASSLISPNLKCEVKYRDEIEKLKMGAYLGVAMGSAEPPKLIVLKYSPPQASKTITLIGKGVTFDSGGLSLKTASGMETMKYDMTGAAVVIATLKAVAELNLECNVTAIVAACENMPDGKALRPGDVLTAMNGKTIEVNNTDAEGRLTLADALYFASQDKPDAIIDIATLTGAIVTALGRTAAGVMGNNQELIDSLISHGKEAGEKLWQMPMFDEYSDTLKSDIADLKNAGARGEAGSSSAAMFLREFVDSTPWAHLDIAGTAWTDKERDELPKGPTAFGVRTLCYLLAADLLN